MSNFHKFHRMKTQEYKKELSSLTKGLTGKPVSPKDPVLNPKAKPSPPSRNYQERVKQFLQEKSKSQKPESKQLKAILHSHNYEPSDLADENYDEFGYPIHEKLKKTIVENFESLEKAKKDMMPMFGASPEQHHHDFANWASKALPNKDWQVWAARNYKKDPSAFTPEVKESLEHFGGSSHMPEVAKVRFDKSHDVPTGVGMFQQAEEAYNKRIGQNLNVVKPDPGTKKIMDVGGGMAWYSLGRGACPAEGKAMGHCGNVPSKEPGDVVLSLRSEHKNSKGEVFHEPHATFIVNNGYLGEMKGRANTKPDAKYHKAIADLLLHPKIKGVVGGGYLHHQNFSIEDLKPDQKERVLSQKPNISVYDGDQTPNDLPEKFESEVKPVLKFKQEAKIKYGKDWRQGMLEDIAVGKSPKMALNAVSNPTDDELHHVINGPNTNQDTRVQAAMIGKDSARLHTALAEKSPDDINYLNKPNVDAILNTKNHNAIGNLAANQSLTSKQVDKLVNHPDFNSFDYSAHVNLLNREDLDPKHHEKFLNSPHESARMQLARQVEDPALQEKLANDYSENVRSNLARRGKNISKEVQQRLYDKGHLKELSENQNLHPEIGNQIASHASKNDPDTISDIQEIRDNLLQNRNTSPEALREFHGAKGGLDESQKHDLYNHENLPKDVFDKMYNEDTKDPDSYARSHKNILKNPHLSKEQYKNLSTKFGKYKNKYDDKKFEEDYKQHFFYKPKASEIKPSAPRQMLRNHMDRLKAESPEKHAKAQDKLIDQAIESGDLGHSNNLIQSGVLDDEHHAKLHDNLAEVVSGDHKHSDKYVAPGRKYQDMIYNHLGDQDLPQSYHEEAFKRLEDDGEDPSDISNRVFNENKDDYSDEASERAHDIARENYPFSEYIDDVERGRGHPLDEHIDNSRRLKDLQDHVHDQTMQELADRGKLDEEGNYSDSDYEEAADSAKDEIHRNLRKLIDEGDNSGFPEHLHNSLDRYRDDLYEHYDESVRDSGHWDHAYGEALNEKQEEMMSNPDMWPEHLQNTDWVKNNIVKPKKQFDTDSEEHGGFADDEEKLAASERQGNDLNKASSLKKMSRPRLTFPNLKQVSTRPDQDVRTLETGKQKELYGRIAGNAAVKEYLKNNPRSVINPQKAAQKEASRVEGRFDRRSLGLNYPVDEGKSFSAALAGKLRSKYEEGDEQDQAKMAEHDQKVKEARAKYVEDYNKWREKMGSIPGGSPQYYLELANRPKFTKPRKPAKRLKATTELSPEKMAARGKAVDTTIEHEALHDVLNQIHHHYGPEARKNTIDKLLSNHNPDTLNAVADWIADTRGYKRASKHFNEEVLTHTRDLLTEPKKREKFKEYIQRKHGADGESIAAQHIKNLKQGHNKAYKMAQNLTAEDISGQKMPASTKLAASEQARVQQTKTSWKFPEKPKKVPKAQFVTIEGENPKAIEDQAAELRQNMEKGAAKRLHGKVDPLKLPGREKVKEWQESTGFVQNLDSNYDDEQHQAARAEIPGMEAGARHRALNKLSSNTLTRRHPETGERQFLLFRGIGQDENHTIYPKHIHSVDTSSWTPHLHVARGFESERTDDYNTGKTVGAWVNESDIHSSPLMYGNLPGLKMDMDDAGEFYVPDTRLKGRNEYADEHEVIVKPHKSMRATKADVARYEVFHRPMRTRMQQTKDLDARINYRGQQEKAGFKGGMKATNPIPQKYLEAAGIGMKKPKKMAASEDSDE